MVQAPGSTTVRNAVSLMLEHGTERLLVVDDGGSPTRRAAARPGGGAAAAMIAGAPTSMPPGR